MRFLGLVLRRFLIPHSVVSLYGMLRWRAVISPRAEVELSGNLRLGRHCTVSSFTKIKATDGLLVTGDRCGFGAGCFVDTGSAGIVLGSHVLCGPNVVLVATNYVYGRLGVPVDEQGVTSLGIRIGSNSWIGANSVILDGAAIGENSVVAAGSVVNRHFPPNSIIQGNPARLLLRRYRDPS